MDEVLDRYTMTEALMQQPDEVLFLISDRDTSRVEGDYSYYGRSIQRLIDQGQLFRADTLEELADQMGCDKNTFAATVERYNEIARNGEDPDFGRMIFTPDSPIENPPFYASPRTWAAHITEGGVVTDETSQVLREDGTPIEGLYAVGNCAGGFYGGTTSEQQAGGATGIIMTSDGYIITNWHCVINEKTNRQFARIQVTTYDGTKYDQATVIGADKDTDLAVIKINAANLKAAEFGDSSQLSMGDRVVALGNAGGLEWSASQGIVSGTARDVYDDTGYSIKCLQTDAAINPGNSGGPLLNNQGQVIGVNSAKIVAEGYEGLGFSIPIKEAKVIIDDLLKYGYVKGRVMLGIMGNEVATPGYEGFMINSINEGSVLQGTKAQAGDIITHVNKTYMRQALQAYFEKSTEAEPIRVDMNETRIRLITEETFVNPFTDVAETDWFYDVVLQLAKDGIVNGMTETTFEPQGTLTRAEFATMLYRVSYAPVVTGESTYSDVKTGDWYYNAVVWATEAGVVNGMGDGTFAPNDNITRQEMATMLYRLAKAEKVEEDKLASFPDAASVADWAKDAMNWAVSTEIVNGSTHDDKVNYLDPTATALRCQAAAVACRYLALSK